jgi:outer membrane protein assembly factor BamB
MLWCTVPGSGDVSKLPTTNDGRNPKMNNPYPVIYGSALRNSIATVAVRAVGKKTWKTRREVDELLADGYLLSSYDAVLIVSEQKISAYQFNGTRIWTQLKWPASGAWIFDDAVYVQLSENKSKLKKILCKDGTIVRADISMPSTQEKSNLIFLEPSARGFIACCKLPSTQILQNGKPTTTSPWAVFYGKSFDDWDFEWIGEIQAVPIVLPIHLTSQKQFILFTPHEYMVYACPPSARDAVLSCKSSYPLEKISSISADIQGNLIFAGTIKNKSTIIASDVKGLQQWKWDHYSDFELSEVPLPVCPNGEVIVKRGATVCAVANAKIIWEYNTDLSRPEYVTVSIDNCVLVSAGERLYCLQGGMLKFVVDVEDTIIAPPVLDAQGSIYVLTRKDLIKIE